MADYLFRSERIGFRVWEEKDIESMVAINSDPVVMEYFPSVQNRQKTLNFIKRQQDEFQKRAFCFFAADLIESAEFIGFIGLQNITFEADFYPGIEIGWRVARNHWGFGYATEGAQKCLDYSKKLGIKHILSFTPLVNQRSERVMQKIGMKRIREFNHPLLEKTSHLSLHVLYEISL